VIGDHVIKSVAACNYVAQYDYIVTLVDYIVTLVDTKDTGNKEFVAGYAKHGIYSI
jgi:hypothetical protein